MNPVLILTHNGLALTKRCVESVRGNWKKWFSVIPLIVDNGSTDGTLEWAKKEARVGHHFRIIAFTALVGVLSLGWEVFVRLPHRMDHLEFNTKTAIEMSSKPAVGATTANQFVVSAGTLPAEIHPTEGTQIEVTWLKPCWGSYTDQIGKVTQVGNVEGGYVGNYFVFGPITIRSVCPGYVRYRVNGELVSPPNLSRTPEKSEVVTLPEPKEGK